MRTTLTAIFFYIVALAALHVVWAQEQCFRGKCVSKNKNIRERVDSRVQYVWRLQLMGSWFVIVFFFIETKQDIKLVEKKWHQCCVLSMVSVIPHWYLCDHGDNMHEFFTNSYCTADLLERGFMWCIDFVSWSWLKDFTEFYRCPWRFEVIIIIWCQKRCQKLDFSRVCGIFLSWIHWLVTDSSRARVNRTHVGHKNNGRTPIVPATGSFAAFLWIFLAKLEKISPEMDQLRDWLLVKMIVFG